MTYDIIATGSSGNAVVINGEILIDIGVSMKKLRESGYIKNLKLVLLTHEHGDHFNAATVRALHKERPALRWGCCEWMVPHLLDAGVDKRTIDVFDVGDGFNGYHYKKTHSYIVPVPLVHDVPNCGYRIIIRNEYLFYATDTNTLDHIDAKNYDCYLIEANHTCAEIEARIVEKQARGEFAYETRAAQNHLSQEQALDWLARNSGPNSRYVFLHQHRGGEDMTEYIERNAAVMALTLHDCDSAGAKVAILDLPVADVVPVVHGHWIKPSTNAWDHYCSVCKGPKPYFYGYGALDSAFCPNCGAKIDKEAN